MRGKQGVRLAVARLALAIGSLVLGTSAVQAQPARGAKPASTPFTEAVAQAKKTGRPLVVFGMSETCLPLPGLETGPRHAAGIQVAHDAVCGHRDSIRRP